MTLKKLHTIVDALHKRVAELEKQDSRLSQMSQKSGIKGYILPLKVGEIDQMDDSGGLSLFFSKKKAEKWRQGLKNRDEFSVMSILISPEHH